jgi:hypothetical protein
MEKWNWRLQSRNDWLGLTESFEDVGDDDLRIPGGENVGSDVVGSSSRACIL